MVQEQSYISVHVCPRSGASEVVGLEDAPNGPELKVRVTAPPDNGKANDAVCKLIAQSLGLSKSSVSVLSGHTSRHKRLICTCSQDCIDAYLGTFK